MQFKSILAAIDLDDDLAEGVVKAADSLALKDGAVLEIVSVWPALTATTQGFSADIGASSAVVTETLMQQHREGRQKSAEKLRALANRMAPSAKTLVLDGEAAAAIARHAAKAKADLIVTGSHQRKFWGALFQGSASFDLIREAPCAVFLVTKACAATLSK